MSKTTDRNLVTRPQLAGELGIHPRTVTRFLEEGLPCAKRGKGGRASLYDVDECRAWKEAREQLENTDGPIDLMKERARKERAQALLAEQLYAVRSGKLLDSDEVQKAWVAEIAAARSVILSSYTTAADRVFRAGTTEGLAGVEKELKAIAFTVLKELADGVPKKRSAA